MRFLFILLFPVLFSNYLNAQTATDTIMDFFNMNGSTLVSSPNGGYVSGTNGYGDSEKLQAFFPLRSYSILGAFVWTGKKVFNSGDSNSRICLKVKNFDTTTVSTYPYFKGIGATIDSAWFALSDPNPELSFDSGLKYYSFSSPVLVNSYYALGIAFDGLAKDSTGNLLDSVAIFSSAIDSVSFPKMSWEKWNGNYKRIADTWGFDIDLALFPVIDSTLNSVSGITNLDFNIYPNPASDFIQIQAKIPANSKVEIIDMLGKTVLIQGIEQDLTSMSVNIQSVNSGYYLIKITSNNKIGIKPFLIKK
jgi:hypothetical protein